MLLLNNLLLASITQLLVLSHSFIGVSAQIAGSGTREPLDVPAVYPIVPIGDTVFTTGASNTIEWESNSTLAIEYEIVSLNLILGTGTGNQVTELDTIVTGLKFPDTVKYDYALPWKKYDVSQNCE
jgi:hypothetical protein